MKTYLRLGTLSSTYTQTIVHISNQFYLTGHITFFQLGFWRCSCITILFPICAGQKLILCNCTVSLMKFYKPHGIDSTQKNIVENLILKIPCHEISDPCIFHQSISPRLQINILKQFRILLWIRRDIRLKFWSSAMPHSVGPHILYLFVYISAKSLRILKIF
jgi:hypothetical protein